MDPSNARLLGRPDRTLRRARPPAAGVAGRRGAFKRAPRAVNAASAVSTAKAANARSTVSAASAVSPVSATSTVSAASIASTVSAASAQQKLADAQPASRRYIRPEGRA